jgi:hypothetical protein
MKNETSGTIILGATREFLCNWCTSVKRKRLSRQHIYTERWRAGRVARFWECSVCGHQRSVSTQDHVREEKADLETELLHAQWREDNKP